jgi:pimeloyl-ACP methyl ester carboxylesterase
MESYDLFLSRWPVAYATHTINTRVGTTFVIASGKEASPPLILLHGAGTNSIMWAGEIAEYAKQYRIYAADLPGEPGKSAASRPDWASEAYAEWLEDVLDGLGVDRAALIGFSQGGWTALKFSVSHTERVEKLVLLSPGGIIPDKLSFVFRALPLSMLGKWGARQVNHLLAGDQVIPPDMDDALTLTMTHFKPRIERLPIFSDRALQRLTMPVLVLIGDRDALRDARKIITRLKQHVPDINARIITGGGHALMSTVEMILPFLSGKS